MAALEGTHLARNGIRIWDTISLEYSATVASFLSQGSVRRCVVMPPIELDPDAEIEAIGAEVFAALDAFEESLEKLSPEQWSRLNKEYMDFVGARSVSAFERAKSEVTIRYDTSSNVYVLFANGGKEVELQSPSKTRLAEHIVKLLK